MNTIYNCPNCGNPMVIRVMESDDDEPQEKIYLDCKEVEDCGYWQTAIREKSNDLVLMVIESSEDGVRGTTGSIGDAGSNEPQ